MWGPLKKIDEETVWKICSSLAAAHKWWTSVKMRSAARSSWSSPTISSTNSMGTFDENAYIGMKSVRVLSVDDGMR
jgi:hypothetical protein